jgi:hypothetical protein
VNACPTFRCGCAGTAKLPDRKIIPQRGCGWYDWLILLISVYNTAAEEKKEEYEDTKDEYYRLNARYGM